MMTKGEIMIQPTFLKAKPGDKVFVGFTGQGPTNAEVLYKLTRGVVGELVCVRRFDDSISLFFSLDGREYARGSLETLENDVSLFWTKPQVIVPQFDIESTGEYYREKSMKPRSDKFYNARVGDRVFSFFGGPVRVEKDGRETNAEIIETRFDETFVFPITVQLDSGEIDDFTADGEFYSGGRFSCLFWSKPDFAIPPAPKRTFKKTWYLNYSPTRSYVYRYDNEGVADNHKDKDTIRFKYEEEVEE
jgi:hypothetical protein